MTPIHVLSTGAVTPVGLDSFATCAAVRARASRIAEVYQRPPPAEAVRGCRIPAGRGLRRSAQEWLLNMASKALTECASGLSSADDVVLLLFPPESRRDHPGMAGLTAAHLLYGLSQRTGLSLSAHSEVRDTGAGGLLGVLDQVSALLAAKRGRLVIVGGFDSLLNSADMTRLEKSNRLYVSGNPQGVIPGEGAAFVAFGTAPSKEPWAPLATVIGAASADESAGVEGSDYSLGVGFGKAFTQALAATQGKVDEAALGFVCSTDNGERYAAWESVFHRARSYRTRRERLPILVPAMSYGEIGSAASAMSLIIASVAIARGYAPGKIGVVEARSEGPARGVCILDAAPHAPAFSAPGVRRAMDAR